MQSSRYFQSHALDYEFQSQTFQVRFHLALIAIGVLSLFCLRIGILWTFCKTLFQFALDKIQMDLSNSGTQGKDTWYDKQEGVPTPPPYQPGGKQS